MQKSSRSIRVRLQRNVRSRILSGLLVLVPLGITLLIFRLLLSSVAGVLQPLTDRLFESLPDYAVTLLSIVALLLLIYFTGLVAAHVVGRRMIAWMESILVRIPLVRSIYTSSKQVVEVLSFSTRPPFKAAVLVEFPGPGLRAVGFVTGDIVDAEGVECHKVFIPTTPNPTSGFLQVIPCDKVRYLKMTPEQAIKMVISGGILSPGRLEPAPGAISEPPETL